MHVAILGAGALGTVYGVLLALRAGAEVSFVVRPAQVDDASPLVIERADAHGADELAAPRRVASVPADADVVLVCVRGEQIDAALAQSLAAGSMPVVTLTPLLEEQREMLARALGARFLAGMPSVVAYVSERGPVRYWLPRSAATAIEQPSPPRAEIAALVDALGKCGIHARTEQKVHETNAATTVTFMPIAMALDVAGSVDALLADKALLGLALDGAHEGMKLAHAIGKPAAWAELLTKFVGKMTLKIGVGLARRRAPEAVRYAETHFGRKLHAQNLAMGESMVRLAARHGIPHPALDALLARLRAMPAGS